MSVGDWAKLLTLVFSVSTVVVGLLIHLAVRLTRIELTQKQLRAKQDQTCRAVRRLAKRLRELMPPQAGAAECAGRRPTRAGPPAGGAGARG